MAVTWRVSIEAVEGVESADSIIQFCSDDQNKPLIVELSDGRNAQRTRPFEVPEGGGKLLVARVLFVPAPAPGRCLMLRALRPVASGQSMPCLIGEAQMPAILGATCVELMLNGRLCGLLRLTVTERLPSYQGLPPLPRVEERSPLPEAACASSQENRSVVLEGFSSGAASPLPSSALPLFPCTTRSSSSSAVGTPHSQHSRQLLAERSQSGYGNLLLEAQSVNTPPFLQSRQPSLLAAGAFDPREILGDEKQVMTPHSQHSTRLDHAFVHGGIAASNMQTFTPRSLQSRHELLDSCLDAQDQVQATNEETLMPHKLRNTHMQPHPGLAEHHHQDVVADEHVCTPRSQQSSRPQLSERHLGLNIAPVVMEQVAAISTCMTDELKNEQGSNEQEPALVADPGLVQHITSKHSIHDPTQELALSINAPSARMRHPALPFLGNCDIIVEYARDLPPHLKQPYFRICLEGQEFIMEDISRTGLLYTFPIASVQSDVLLYCCESADADGKAAGRIAVPLTDVLQPVGQVPRFALLKESFTKELRPLKQQYRLKFMPPSKSRAMQSETGILERFELTRCSKDDCEAFGEVCLSIELTLSSEVRSLLGFYGYSMMAGLQGDGPFHAIDADLFHQDCLLAGPDEPSLPDFMISHPLNSLLNHLVRLRFALLRPPCGLLRFLREESWHGQAAALCWFVFCMLGFFPCPLWLAPVYLWFILFCDGLLVASQRQRDWQRKDGGARLFRTKEAVQRIGDPAVDVIASLNWQLQEVLPFIRLLTTSLERARNMFTFADGAASTVLFLGLGVALGVLSLLLRLAMLVDSNLSILCGVSGAAILLVFSRPPPPPLPPAPGSKNASADPSRWGLLQTLMGGLTVVPDAAELAHRFVATRIQVLEPSP